MLHSNRQRHAPVIDFRPLRSSTAEVLSQELSLFVCEILLSRRRLDVIWDAPWRWDASHNVGHTQNRTKHLDQACFIMQNASFFSARPCPKHFELGVIIKSLRQAALKSFSAVSMDSMAQRQAKSSSFRKAPTRTLLGTKGIASRSVRTLLGAPGLTTRSKDATNGTKGIASNGAFGRYERGSWHRYSERSDVTDSFFAFRSPKSEDNGECNGAMASTE